MKFKSALFTTLLMLCGFSLFLVSFLVVPPIAGDLNLCHEQEEQRRNSLQAQAEKDEWTQEEICYENKKSLDQTDACFTQEQKKNGKLLSVIIDTMIVQMNNLVSSHKIKQLQELKKEQNITCAQYPYAL